MIEPTYIELMNMELDGTATESQRSQLRRYLEGHPEAATYYDELARVVRRLNAEPQVEPPAQLHPRIMAAVDRAEREPLRAGGWFASLLAPSGRTFATFGMGLAAGVFLLAAVPAALAVITLLAGVREAPHPVRAATRAGLSRGGLDRAFWRYLGVLLLFTLGNSTDALLILRASDLGVTAALVPVLWAMLHVVKSASSTPGGVLSDRLGRRPTLARALRAPVSSVDVARVRATLET